MFADEVGEVGDGVIFRDIELDGGFADIEVNFAGGTADVAEIRVGHFAWAIDDTAHHGDANALEMAGGGTDFLSGVLQVEERATTTRASHIVGFKNAGTGGLQDVIGQAE